MTAASLRFCMCHKCRMVYFIAVATYATSPARIAFSQSLYLVDDLQNEVRLSSVQISPDGKQLVVVTSRPDYEDNKFVNQLCLVDVPVPPAIQSRR